jgi:hypothetical protein
MKKLVCAAVVLAVGSSVFASQVPQQKPVVQVNGLRASSDAIAITAVKKKMDRDGDVYSGGSSGSSPIGAEHLFPGQSGLGQWGKYMAPVCPSDCNFKGREGFFH